MDDQQSIIDEVKEALIAGAKENNLPVVYILKEQYRQIPPEVRHQQEIENHCVLVPVDRYEMERVKADAVPYTTMPHFPIPEPPEIVMYDNPYRGKFGGNKTPKIPPKDYAKKKKAKRRAQKQARRKR